MLCYMCVYAFGVLVIGGFGGDAACGLLAALVCLYCKP
jgi:hypothetical protein